MNINPAILAGFTVFLAGSLLAVYIIGSFYIEKQFKLLQDLQHRVDQLMLEYCPEEMTKEQLDAWADAQQVSSDQQVVGNTQRAVFKDNELVLPTNPFNLLTDDDKEAKIAKDRADKFINDRFGG